MSGYGRDFMGRVRGMWDRFSGPPHDAEPPRGPRAMQATGPGGEGYFISRDMAYDAEYVADDRPRDGDGRGSMGGMAPLGRSGAGRGYGGDYRTGRGGYDRGEFYRGGAGGTGYRPGYERDPGMRGGRGYGAEYTYGGFATGYDRGYRGGPARGGRDDRLMGEAMPGDHGRIQHNGGGIGQSSPHGGWVRPAGRLYPVGRYDR